MIPGAACFVRLLIVRVNDTDALGCAVFRAAAAFFRRYLKVRGAVPENEIAQGGNRRGQRHFPQPGAAIESIIPDKLNGQRDIRLFQRDAPVKRKIIHLVKGNGKLRLFQSGAAVKSEFPYGGDRLRQHGRSKGRAAVKSIVPDPVKGAGQSGLLKGGAAIEHKIPR